MSAAEVMTTNHSSRRRGIAAAGAALVLALLPVTGAHAEGPPSTEATESVQAEVEQLGGGQFPGAQLTARVHLSDASGAPLPSSEAVTARLTDGAGQVSTLPLSPLGEGRFLLEGYPANSGPAVVEVFLGGDVIATASLDVAAFAGTRSADADEVILSRPTPVTPGVRHQELSASIHGEPVVGDLVTVDLRYSGVGVGLLHDGVVGSSAAISTQLVDHGAVAGINGDFFDISGTDHHAEPTFAPVGPAIADGTDFGGPVPLGQRFGPPLSTETEHVQTVFAAGPAGALVTELTVDGTVNTPHGELDVAGLDQYAVAENGVAVFTAQWGPSSRLRATCGTDTGRNDPCADNTREVVVTDGVVTAVNAEPGHGQIGPEEFILVGREAGADALADLTLGDAVALDAHLQPATEAELDFAVGGTPILRDGAPMPGVEQGVFAARSAVGTNSDGDRVYLLTIDGGSEHSAGYDILGLAELLVELGASEGLNLDGGGSTTLVTNGSRDDGVTVQNEPSGGVERPVPNGIGVFSYRS